MHLPYIGDQVWLITSRQTDPLLFKPSAHHYFCPYPKRTYCSSIFGWKILFIKPIDGLLYGYCSGSSTWILHTPPSNGAILTLACQAAAEFELHTFRRTFKLDVEFRHAIVDKVDIEIRHQAGHAIVSSRAAAETARLGITYSFMTSVSVRRFGELMALKTGCCSCCSRSGEQASKRRCEKIESPLASSSGYI